MGEAARRKKAGNYPTNTIKLPRNGAATSGPTTPTWPLPKQVTEFARTLSDAEPVMLPFTDVGSNYISGACHLNVAHRVKHHGGERISGWMIWASSKFTEGEFHSVWRSPSGDLCDITPRVDGEEMILFLPDPNTKVEPRGAGAIIPSNRTSMPGVPYTSGGVPSARANYREPDLRTRQHMTKLGMSHFVGEVA